MISLTYEALVVVCIFFWTAVVLMANLLVMAIDFMRPMAKWYLPYSALIWLLISWLLMQLI